MEVESNIPNEKCEICDELQRWEDIISVNRWNFKGKVCRECLHALKHQRPEHAYRICKTKASDYIIQKENFDSHNGDWDYTTLTIKGRTNFASFKEAEKALKYYKHPKDKIIEEVVGYYD